MAIWVSVKEMLEEGLRGKTFSDINRLKQFIEANEFTRCCYGRINTTDLCRTLKTGRSNRKCSWYELEKGTMTYGYNWEIPPYCDHAMNFKRKGENQVCMTYSPYCGNKPEDFLNDKAEIEKWADERGLIADVIPPDKGWYYPNRAYFVIIRFPDYNVEIPN